MRAWGGGLIGGRSYLEGVSQVDQERVVQRREQLALRHRERVPHLTENILEILLLLHLHRVGEPAVALDDLHDLAEATLAEDANDAEVIHSGRDELLRLQREHVPGWVEWVEWVTQVCAQDRLETQET